jgi:glycosyltransferase involved in cell wall biosynthesis
LCKCNDKLAKEFKKEDVEVVIATMNRKSLDFLIPMFPFCHFSKFSILIINQTEENCLLTSEFASIRVINSFDCGLSKSRNLGLEKAKGNIVLISDDDEIFKKNFDLTLIKAFNAFPKAAVICFRLEKPDGTLFKKYCKKTKVNPSQLDLFSVFSPEMCINKAVVEASNVKFDTNFGLGSTFMMGEEAVFLTDLKLKKQEIVLVPNVIAVNPIITTTDKLDFEQKYYVQGAFFSRVLKKRYLKGLFLKLFFDIKQNKLKISQIPTAIRNATQGKNDFYNAC